MYSKQQHSSLLKQRSDDFFERVYEIVMQIPYGKVTTYGHIAKALGAKSSARVVGYALNGVSHHDRNQIPCHRVVNRNGDLSGKMHFETPTIMRELLEAEGVNFLGDRVDMSLHLWEPDISID